MSRVQPGMPEHGNLGDRLARLERQVSAMNRGAQTSFSSDGTDTWLRSGNLRILQDGKVQVVSAAGDVFADFDKDGVDILEADGTVIVRLDGTGLRLNDGAGTKLIDLTTSGLRAYEADGSTMMVLDGSKLRFNRSDGSRQLEITPAGGMKFYQADGSTVITTLDGSGLTVGNAPVIIDADGLDIGSGLTVIDASGVQVGTDVVMDSTGLHVNGGDVVAVEAQRGSDGSISQTVDTTTRTFATVTVNPPSWAQAMICQAFIRCQFVENTVQKNVTVSFRINTETAFDGLTQTLPNGATQSFTVATSFTETSTGISLPSSFDLSVRASVNTGSNDTNFMGLRVHPLFLRS